MVVCGDFGIEIFVVEVFVVQKKIIVMCNIVGKFVICVIQMFEFMIKNFRLIRVEISDVGNVVIDGVDCVMVCLQ